MTSIIVENVTKRIRKNIVLDCINIELRGRRVYGLKGVNGSGKTMLMRVISGLIRPTTGRVLINNKELHRDISFPESIGLLLESPAFLDAYSGEDNLKILASIKGLAKDERVCKVINEVGLDDAKKKKYRKYSLGMKQRLGIAAAIMENPDIIILDEPTNALDDDGIEVVKKIVYEEKQRGALIIISCHDAAVLNELSDEVFCINNGKIVDHIVLGEE